MADVDTQKGRRTGELGSPAHQSIPKQVDQATKPGFREPANVHSKAQKPKNKNRKKKRR